MALWSKRLAIKDTMDPSGRLSDKIQNKGQGAERMVNKQLVEPTEGPGWGSGAAAFVFSESLSLQPLLPAHPS